MQTFLAGPWKLLWLRDKACLQFWLGPSYCPFEVLGWKGKGWEVSNSVRQLYLPYRNPVKCACLFDVVLSLFWINWYVQRSVTGRRRRKNKKEGVLSTELTDVLEFKLFVPCSVLEGIWGYWSFRWKKNHFFSMTGLQKLHPISWCSILNKTFQTLCAWSEPAERRQLKAERLNVGLWFTVTWADLFSGVCESVECVRVAL